MLKIQAVKSDYRIIFNKRYLRRAIADAATGDYRIFHFSSHGDDDGVRLCDGTDIDWLEFARLLRPLANGKRSLVLSSCKGGHVGLTKALTKLGATFEYVFGSTSDDGVGFTDSCLAWSILYSRLGETGFGTSPLQRSMNIINSAIDGDFVYRRWNGRVYLRHPTP